LREQPAAIIPVSLMAHDRTRRDLKDRGVPMAMGTLVSFIERAADLLAPIDGLHWQQLLASAWMATDDTGLKVLIPGLPAAHNGYIELYRNLGCAVFQYEADKASEHLAPKRLALQRWLTPTQHAQLLWLDLHFHNNDFEMPVSFDTSRTLVPGVNNRRIICSLRPSE